MTTATPTDTLVSALQLYQFLNANPASELATQFDQALTDANTAQTWAEAETTLAAFFQNSGIYADVDPADFSTVADYVYAQAPAWANFADHYTYTLLAPSANIVELSRHSGIDRRNPDCSDANNPCQNDGVFLKPTVLDPSTPCGQVDFVETNDTSLPDIHGGYAIAYTAPDGSVTPLFFDRGQLVSELGTATPSIRLQTTFAPLALFSGESGDTGTIVPTLFGIVQGGQAIGLNAAEVKTKPTVMDKFKSFFTNHWQILSILATAGVAVGTFTIWVSYRQWREEAAAQALEERYEPQNWLDKATREIWGEDEWRKYIDEVSQGIHLASGEGMDNRDIRNHIAERVKVLGGDPLKINARSWNDIVTDKNKILTRQSSETLGDWRRRVVENQRDLVAHYSQQLATATKKIDVLQSELLESQYIDGDLEKSSQKLEDGSQLIESKMFDPNELQKLDQEQQNHQEAVRKAAADQIKAKMKQKLEQDNYNPHPNEIKDAWKRVKEAGDNNPILVAKDAKNLEKRYTVDQKGVDFEQLKRISEKPFEKILGIKIKHKTQLEKIDEKPIEQSFADIQQQTQALLDQRLERIAEIPGVEPSISADKQAFEQIQEKAITLQRQQIKAGLEDQLAIQQEMIEAQAAIQTTPQLEELAKNCTQNAQALNQLDLQSSDAGMALQQISTNINNNQTSLVELINTTDAQQSTSEKQQLKESQQQFDQEQREMDKKQKKDKTIDTDSEHFIDEE